MRSPVLSLAALIIALALPADAAVVNVKDYGAKADGKTDDTPAFTSALQAAAKEEGSTVFAPAGRYVIAGTITIPFYTTLQGEYRGPGRQEGTTLLATGGRGKSNGPGCIACSGYSHIRNIAIEYPEQSADAAEPIPYPYAITMAGTTSVEEVFLYNAYQGILADEAPCSDIRKVWGEPLRVGITVDHALDICRVENVHFWPYFTQGKPLRKWVQANGVAFEFGRSDWQYCLNTFCYGYKTGYRFFRSPATGPHRPEGVTNGNFLGIGADSCTVAVDVEDSFAVGVSITNGEFVSFNGEDCCAIRLHKSNTGNITLTNCNFWAVANTVAEVHGGGLNLSACNINDWGASFWQTDNPDTPCLVLTGGRVNVNGCTINRGGLIATLEGAGARALFTGNLSTEPLSVVSKIGNRALLAANSPTIEALREKPKPVPGAPKGKPRIPEMPDH